MSPPLATPLVVLVCFTDIDECRSSRRICTNGVCVNTPGSFRCDCYAGYEVSATGDECHGNDDDDDGNVFPQLINLTYNQRWF